MTDRWNTWDHCANAAVRRAARRLGQLYDDALAPSGLRSTQHLLLTQILGSGEPTQRALAEAMVMDLSALGHTLKPLVRDGLVELVPDARDGRARRVRLTLLGRQRQAEGLALWRAAHARFEAAFGVAETAAMLKALDRIASEDFAAAFERPPAAAPAVSSGVGEPGGSSPGGARAGAAPPRADDA